MFHFFVGCRLRAACAILSVSPLLPVGASHLTCL